MPQQVLHLAGTGVSALACLFMFIAMVTTGWLKGTGFDYGIFRFCIKDKCFTLDPTGSETAVRFLVVVAFLLAVTGFIVAAVYFIKYVRPDVPNRTLPFVAGLELLVAGGAAILGIIIFVAKVKVDTNKVTKCDVGYSFGIEIVAALLSLASGALILVNRQQHGSLSPAS